MPQKSKLKLPPLDLGKESIGERIAYLRKEKGLSQLELAKKIGITQALVSSYEINRLRLYTEMIARFAKALDVSTDNLIGLKLPKNGAEKPSLKLMRRLRRIDTLPLPQQKILLQTIDTFLKGAGK